MQFTPENIAKIQKGLKTQTRRLVGEREFVLPGLHLPQIQAVVIEDGNGDNRHRIKWAVGRTYAMCPGRGQPAEGRIKLLAIRRQNLCDISEEDARAEGCRSVPAVLGGFYTSARTQFKYLWNDLHKLKGTRWADNPVVWCLTFEAVLDIPTEKGSEHE